MNRTLHKLLAIIILLSAAVPASPQFIRNEDKTDSIAEKAKPSKKEEMRAYPDQIAYNIKAIIDPDKKNSVKITWDVNSDSKHEFIIGRHGEKMDTPAKALKSSSLDSIPSAAKGVVFDYNLKPGSYYYVVLSKDAIRKREIELYPDVNFTVIPVIIEDEKKTIAGPMIAEAGGMGTVIIRWDRGDKSGVTYGVYRGREVINSRDRLMAAKKIGEAHDIGQLIDRGITSAGIYYYAITTRRQDSEEDASFIPDVTYTTKGHIVYTEDKKSSAISGIISDVSADGAVVSWKGEHSETPVKGFAVYRHTSIISNYDNLTRAKHIVTLPSDARHYTDRALAEGSYYYAVIVKFTDDRVDLEMKNGVNYTIEPVIISGKKIVPSREMNYPPVERETASAGIERDIDTVIARTFFKRKYYTAIKELEIISRSSDNENEKAKAKLFIGRSYIELGKYQQGIKYLVRDDVEKYYPEEAKFWRDFAYFRLK